MDRRLKVIWIFFVFSVCLPAVSSATIIEYSSEKIDTSKYRYEYTVTNNTMGGALLGFDIFFDPVLYEESSLTLFAPSPDWSGYVLSSFPGMNAMADFYSDSGIAQGEALGSFAVEFLWLGTGDPGMQWFEIYDSQSYEILEDGYTVEIASAPVPEPATLLLVSTGIGAFGLFRRKKSI